MKTPVEIEKLVRWAYRDELPKEDGERRIVPAGFSFAWGGVAEYGKLLAVVDDGERRNRYGVVPDLTAQTGPHPDAVSVHEAVTELDASTVTLPEDWNPLTDMGDLGVRGDVAVAKALRRLFVPEANPTPPAAMPADGKPFRHFVPARPPADVARVVYKPVSHMVRIAAILGPPDWRAETPVLRRVTHANGTVRWFRREVVCIKEEMIEREIDGFDRKSRRPYPDAYPKEYLDPDPTDAAQTRGEYQIWRAALDVLVDALAGRLEAWEPMNSARPLIPWEVEPPVPPRILRDNRPMQPIIREPRPVAGPPPKRGIERPKEGAER